MENCTDKAIDLNGGQPATTKENKESHGYGIKSIRKAAEKYGGCMTLEQQDGWFIMTVLIPLAEEKSESKTRLVKRRNSASSRGFLCT